MDSLQSKTFITLYNNLNTDAQEEVFSDILNTKTLMQVLKHPTLASGYKNDLMKRHSHQNNTCLYYLISVTQNMDMLHKFYCEFRERDTYWDVISDDMVSSSWVWCIHLPSDDGSEKILILNDYYYQKEFFNIAEYPVPIRFNFKQDIMDKGLSSENLLFLESKRMIPNPEWNVGEYHRPQCIPEGQKEVSFYEWMFH